MEVNCTVAAIFKEKEEQAETKDSKRKQSAEDGRLWKRNNGKFDDGLSTSASVGHLTKLFEEWVASEPFIRN